MVATTILRWFMPRSDPPTVQTVIVETEEQLALRNLQRLEQAKQTLGGRYLLHPSNQVNRLLEERSRALAEGSRLRRVSRKNRDASAVGPVRER